MRAVLNLTIKGKWFDMILRGEKREEYRDCENRQVQRAYLAACNNRTLESKLMILRNGYTMTSRALVVEIKRWDLRGRYSVRHREWGEPTRRRLHIVIGLGNVIRVGKYSDIRKWIKESEVRNG